MSGNSTIGQKLMIFGVLIVLIPSAFIGYFSISESTEGLLNLANEQLETRSEEIALALENTIKGELKIAWDISVGNAPINALNAVIEKGIENSEKELIAVNNRMKRVFDTKQISDGMQVVITVDRNGNIISASNSKYIGINISDRDYFQNAMKGEANVGSVARNKATGEYFVAIAAPVKNNSGSIIGVVANVRGLDFLSSVINKTKIGKTGYAFVIDDTGRVIAHPSKDVVFNENLYEIPDTKQLAGKMIDQKAGVEKYVYKGVKKHAGYAPISVANWSVGLTMPESEFLEKAHSVRNTTLIFIIIFVIIAITVSYYYSSGIKKTINGVKEEIGTIIEAGVIGKLDKRGDEYKVNIEFRQIVTDINLLLDSMVGHFNSVPIPIMIVDKDFNIQFMNNKGAEILQTTNKDLIGKKCYNQFKTSDCNNPNCATGRAMKSGTISDSSTDAHPKGMDLEIDYTANAVKDTYGNIVGGIEIILDKTEERKAKRKEDKINNFQKKEIQKLNAILKKMADGDLSDRYSVEKGDEDTKVVKSLFDEIGENFNETLASLNEVLLKVVAAIDQMESAAGQVSSASQSLSSGTTEQAASLEEVTSSLQTVSNQSKDNAENASGAAKVSDDAKKDAVAGDRRMGDMSAAMVEINRSSEDISKIIKTIDEIAFQTNLLSLNAAVEAARAGKHGKGFAVVAEEVRSLAAKSAKAAKETSELIEESIGKVKNGSQLVDETVNALKKIVEGSGKVAAFIDDINNASGEQSASISQVNEALEQVSGVTQQNAANAEETAAAAEELSSQSQELKSMIGRFKLTDSGYINQSVGENNFSRRYDDDNFDENKLLKS